MSDTIVDGLRQLHDEVLAAGRAYVVGDLDTAITTLGDVMILARAVPADLRRYQEDADER